MSGVRILAPSPARVDEATLAARIAALEPMPSFDARTERFIAALSRALGSEGASRGLPAFQALAFWLRPAEARRLVQRGQAMARPDEVLVSRGVAFHVPPANVDTMFLYSWVLSLAAGNANVVRISSRLLDAQSWLWERLAALLSEPEHAAIAASTLMISYGHDDDITAACSRACDIRVIWGGDGTIETIRRAPLAAHAVDLVFPDRHSFALVGAAAWHALDATGRRRVAERFYNDAFWFDQLGCASPRVVAFVGDGEASDGFWREVAAVAEAKGYVPDAVDVVAKFVAACDAAVRLPVSRVCAFSPAVTVIDLGHAVALPREGPGAGYFFALHVPDVEALSPVIRRRDQTVTTFGVPAVALRRWAMGLNGRGIDRIVPMGEALAFDAVWDGVDLLGALTRRVTVRDTGLGAMQ